MILNFEIVNNHGVEGGPTEINVDTDDIIAVGRSGRQGSDIEKVYIILIGDLKYQVLDWTYAKLLEVWSLHRDPTAVLDKRLGAGGGITIEDFNRLFGDEEDDDDDIF